MLLNKSPTGMCLGTKGKKKRKKERKGGGVGWGAASMKEHI